MFKTTTVVVLAIALLVSSVSLIAQAPAETRPADGGTKEMLMSIFIPPVPNAPFTTTLSTQWVRTLEDGSTLALENHRIIMRDSAGRIFQERCLLVPSGSQTTVNRIEISDPVKHEKYFCDPYKHVCELRDYFAPDATPAMTDSVKRGAGNVTREPLGKRLVSGVEAIGTRETTLIKAGAKGNDRPLTITSEFWYSPQLGINLLVNRTDPRSGAETFETRDLKLDEPAPLFFSVPQGYSVIDQRTGKRPVKRGIGSGSAE